MTINWAGIPLFSGLGPEDITLVQKLFTPVSLDKGCIVIAENSEGNEMFILVKGRVKVTKSMLLADISIPIPGLENSRKVLACLDSSQFPFFGEMALLDKDVRSATVETTEASQFLKTNRARFFALVNEHPTVGVQLLNNLGRLLAHHIRKGNREQVKLTTALALALSRRG